ncbi:hypothetical protein [Fulvivirga sp.]|uniref:hypothetical protein n=1 Tax=Fulvivirga sp. TaxID=1931237 RepID=UPI0032EFF1D9
MDERKANLTLQNFIDRGLFDDSNVQFAGVFENEEKPGEYDIEIGVYNLDRVLDDSPYFRIIDRTRIKIKTHIKDKSFQKGFFKAPTSLDIIDTPRFNGLSSSTNVTRFAFIGTRHCNLCLGTLGAFFEQHNTNRTFFISNWHVLTDGELVLRSPIIQPHDVDRLLLKDKIGELYSYYLDEHMDVAIGILNKGVKINNPNNTIKGFGMPKWGMTLKKHGAGTGDYPNAGAKIISTNCSVRVSHTNYPRGEQVFHRQIMTKDMAAKGDSGSVSVDKSTGAAVGLVFADNGHKYTIHNPIWMILKDKKLPFEITEGVNRGAIMPELNFKKFV